MPTKELTKQYKMLEENYMNKELQQLMKQVEEGKINVPSLIKKIKKGDTKQNVENLTLMIKFWSLQNEIIDNKIKENLQPLKEKKSLKDDAVSMVKEAIEQSLLDMGVQKIKTDFFELSFRKSERVEVDGDVPKEYTRTTVSPDKRKIKKALKSGKTIPNCKLITNQNLQIT